MIKFYTSLLVFLFSSCTTVQYVGSSYPQTNHVDVFVTEASVNRPCSVIGQGYIRKGAGLYSNVINWNKVRKKSIKKGKKNGADGVLIVQHRAISPLPGISTQSHADSAGKRIHYSSRTEPYYPVSTWHEIFFLKYN